MGTQEGRSYSALEHILYTDDFSDLYILRTGKLKGGIYFQCCLSRFGIRLF